MRLDLKTSGIEIEASDISGLFIELSKKFPQMTADEFKNFLYYVNGNAVSGMKLKKTKLNDGDEIMLMSAVAGG